MDTNRSISKWFHTERSANHFNLMYHDEHGGMRVLQHTVGPHGGIGVRPQWVTSKVRALFTFRHDDSVTGNDLDIGFHERISHEATLINRQLVAERLGLSLHDFVFVKQVHGTDVLMADDTHRGIGAFDATSPRTPADAIVTGTKGLAIAILVADCVPVLFYDPIREVIAAAHSGWRGTVGHISSVVVDHMVSRFGSRPEDILVSIGPSIRRCCYEVDDVVANPARAAFGERVLIPKFNQPGKYWFSMQDAIRMDLERHGIMPTHIEDVGLCTASRLNHLFSHRKEQHQAGRQMAVISLA